MEGFISGIIIPIVCLWLLYSAASVIYPLKPFKKRKHATLSLIVTFVGIFIIIPILTLIVAPGPQEKVAIEHTEEQKPTTSIVDNTPEIPSEATIASNENVSTEGVPPEGIPPHCEDGAQITGKQYNVIGSRINVRKGPGTEYERVVNQKSTDVTESIDYVQIDDSAMVLEECTKGGWSWIRVLEPDWLQDSHQGWVLSEYLDREQEVGGDPYAQKIGSYALAPYDAKNYPRTVKQFGLRLKEIEQLRRKMAEIVIDSGKCEFVEASDLSDKSSLQHLYFWVDCRNRERIQMDEFEIKGEGSVFTQKEEAWNESSARTACREAIKSRTLIPSEVDIHEITGTSFYEAPVTHNVVLVMNFDVKNAFGIETPYRAKCYFKPDEVGGIEIYERWR